jgi:hypothetical protein
MQINKPTESNAQQVDIEDYFEVYPNPASNEVWIEYILLNDNPTNVIEILSLDGKTLIKQTIRNNYGIEQIDVSDLCAGNYLIKFASFSKQFSIVK